MKLIWENIALEQLKQVSDYISKSFGDNSKKAFLREIRRIVKLLNINPYIGALDPFLSDRSKPYRTTIISGMDKMVYYIDTNGIIHISAFWDCRRNADNQTRHLL